MSESDKMLDASPDCDRLTACPSCNYVTSPPACTIVVRWLGCLQRRTIAVPVLHNRHRGERDRNAAIHVNSVSLHRDDRGRWNVRRECHK